ncbi:MAG: 30S ribosomal protein S6 [Bacilli bacterium]|nr:30S ribosomal protein S6 [Bacilli bacterium]
MRKYELMYILAASLDDEARKAEIEKLHGILTSSNVTIRDVKEWGMRDFASPMKKQTKGYYVILKLTSEPNGLAEFERLARLNPNVIRYLVTIDQD